MNLFKKKSKFRVVSACGGYIPQVYFKENGGWYGITKTLTTWLSVEMQQQYCVFETEKTAQTILDSYVAIVE